MKTARELLKTAKVGDVIKFKNELIGLVIYSYKIDKSCCVDDKALLLTNFSTGHFWGRVADEFLEYKAEIVKEINCVVIRKWLSLLTR